MPSQKAAGCDSIVGARPHSGKKHAINGIAQGENFALPGVRQGRMDVATYEMGGGFVCRPIGCGGQLLSMAAFFGVLR
jgi:hypothetical protein